MKGLEFLEKLYSKKKDVYSRFKEAEEKGLARNVEYKVTKNGKRFVTYSPDDVNLTKMMEKTYSTTGDETLDDLLEKAFCDGYEYAQKLFFLDANGDSFTAQDLYNEKNKQMADARANYYNGNIPAKAQKHLTKHGLTDAYLSLKPTCTSNYTAASDKEMGNFVKKGLLSKPTVSGNITTWDPTNRTLSSLAKRDKVKRFFTGMFK